MRLRNAIIALLITFLVVGSCIATLSVDYEPPDTTETTVITEDDPRWDCATMGNRICGTTTTVPDTTTSTEVVSGE